MIGWLLGRPTKAPEWAASSFASVAALAGVWWWVAVAAWCTVSSQQVAGGQVFNVLKYLAYPLALSTHGLLWWQVLRGVWALYRDANACPAWPLAITVLWWVALLGFQVLCWLLWQTLSSPAATSGPPWLQF
jgi:hypothetical protein